MNRRLAEYFDIHVVTARFPGCAAYVEDGVSYGHAGRGRSRNASLLTYFAAQPRLVSRFAPDLVIEDFGAPMSTYGLPRFTRTPVVGVVQWLFAREKSREYRLPFGTVEAAGLRTHRRLIAVSDDLGKELRLRAPMATVDVVHNGLPDAAFRTEPSGPRHGFRFLGRLEDAQKGVRLLLDAFDRVADRVSQDLLIAGDGPDRDMLLTEIRSRRLEHRVQLVGSVAQSERFTWLADAEVVVMPSRYETFGMVAAESLAVGSPVICFDIPCLRNLVSDATGRRVPAFAVDEFASAMVELSNNSDLRSSLGSSGRASVTSMTWDRAADQQAAIYRDVLARRA